MRDVMSVVGAVDGSSVGIAMCQFMSAIQTPPMSVPDAVDGSSAGIAMCHIAVFEEPLGRSHP